MILNIVSAVIPSLICGVFLAYFNRKQAEREKKAAARSEARRKENLLGMELSSATAKLALASAMALKRGHANGEVEAGVEAYEQAQKNYDAFIREQANEYIIK